MFLLKEAASWCGRHASMVMGFIMTPPPPTSPLLSSTCFTQSLFVTDLYISNHADQSHYLNNMINSEHFLVIWVHKFFWKDISSRCKTNQDMIWFDGMMTCWKSSQVLMWTHLLCSWMLHYKSCSSVSDWLVLNLCWLDWFSLGIRSEMSEGKNITVIKSWLNARGVIIFENLMVFLLCFSKSH